MNISVQMTEDHKALITIHYPNAHASTALSIENAGILISAIHNVRDQIIEATAEWETVRIDQKSHLIWRGELQTLCGRTWPSYKNPHPVMYPENHFDCKTCQKSYEALPEEVGEDEN